MLLLHSKQLGSVFITDVSRNTCINCCGTCINCCGTCVNCCGTCINYCGTFMNFVAAHDCLNCLQVCLVSSTPASASSRTISTVSPGLCCNGHFDRTIRCELITRNILHWACLWGRQNCYNVLYLQMILFCSDWVRWRNPVWHTKAGAWEMHSDTTLQHRGVQSGRSNTRTCLAIPVRVHCVACEHCARTST